MKSRVTRVLLLVAGGLMILGFFLLPRLQRHQLPLSACFEDAHGLVPGATVRIAGVDVGRVIAVRAQPTDKSCLARVDLVLSTSYELKIPRDAVVGLASEGLLGGQSLAIETRYATGSAADPNSFLRTLATTAPGEGIRALINSATKAAQDQEPQHPAPKKAR
jgi:ABC-type transporter Mla subunit MlaD